MLSKNDIATIRELLYECNSMARECRIRGLEITYKPDKSPVTNADIAISKKIKASLEKLYPEIDIICEEGGLKEPNSYYFWLIDPIDGTRGYIKGHDLYSVNIALVNSEDAEYGFISIPESDRLYYTNENKEFIMEEAGKIVDLPEPEKNFKAVLSGDHFGRAKAHEIMRMHNIVNYEYVPCSAKFCLVASGEADIYPRDGRTMEWDTAAGSAIIKASGGLVTDLENYNLTYRKDNLENKGFIAYSKRLVERDSI